MNEFFLHEQLCALESIAKQYPQGLDCGQRIRKTSDQIISRVYRVAVIGEFKRGKSSLINALLGSEVLPTDILPMTAAINRVVYGERKRIDIRYQDGRTEERSVEELINFGTKYDAQCRERAETVQEIVVHYPSVFCKNHIELIDTPGLNDNDSMTEATMSALGDVDAAIFVTSAREPLSMSEQASIQMLLRQRSIRHFIFVVTCIDVIPTESGQRRVMDLVRRRLCENTLSGAEAGCSGDADLVEKARRILADPAVYAVSSLQAMKGFLCDDEELLEKSRFPAFKSALLDDLTAAQSADMAAKTMDLAIEVDRHLETWYQEAAGRADQEIMQMERKRRAFFQYAESANKQLADLFQTMDASLRRQGIPPDAENGDDGLRAVGRKPFIAGLSSLRTHTASHHNLLAVLRHAADAAADTYAGVCRSMQELVEKEMHRAEETAAAMRTEAGLTPEPLRTRLKEWRDRTSFPQFSWKETPIPAAEDLTRVDIMPQVNLALTSALCFWGERVEGYISSWRSVLMHQIRKDIQDGSGKCVEERLEKLRMQRSALQMNYERHQMLAADIRDKLCAKPR